MRSGGREGIVAVFDELDAALARAAELDFDVLTTPERLALLGRCERVRRRLPAVEHPLVDELRRQAGPAELGGKLAHALADRLRITRAEAARRIGEAADLRPRRALSGEPLSPVLAATAAGQAAGQIGAGGVRVIRRFFQHLPSFVDAETRESAEAHLAELAAQYRPEQLGVLADKLADCLNPDGNYTDADRARRRGLILGDQDPDGMSPLRGWLTPEARATIEAVLAKLAAPGMCDPSGQAPCVDGAPSQPAIDADTRSAPQRNHDGLLAGLRALLASGDLGQHNGLPASIVVTATLADLEAAAGRGLTGGGTLLPMSDVIRLARHAHHYLAIFDKGKALALYHVKRLASPAQRIVLYAKDRGCSAPGCATSGYYCEVHHVTPYAECQETDVNDLTFGCGPHHQLIQPGGWQTRKRTTGETAWIPPPHLDHGQPRVNTFHHPEKVLRDHDKDGDEPPEVRGISIASGSIRFIPSYTTAYEDRHLPAG